MHQIVAFMVSNKEITYNKINIRVKCMFVLGSLYTQKLLDQFCEHFKLFLEVINL